MVNWGDDYAFCPPLVMSVKMNNLSFNLSARYQLASSSRTLRILKKSHLLSVCHLYLPEAGTNRNEDKTYIRILKIIKSLQVPYLLVKIVSQWEQLHKTTTYSFHCFLSSQRQEPFYVAKEFFRYFGPKKSLWE